MNNRNKIVRAGSIYTSLCSQVLFPIHEQLKGHTTVKVRKRLEETQWWPRSKLEDLQFEKLKQLLVHSSVAVPYYRNLFATLGISINDIRCLGDLQNIPFLTKDLIRSHSQALIASNAGRVIRTNTGGSSGEPLRFFLGKERVSHDVAAKWRATRWWGVDIGDPELVVWGSPIELGTQDRIKEIRDRILRTTLLPAFEMSDSKLEEFARNILRTRPRMLFGYPSALSRIATYCERNGIPVSDVGIRVAFVTSEKLYEEQRATIQRTFGCPVANGYGGRDAGFVAHQCPSGGMHITAEDIIVELVDAGTGSPVSIGSPGEIVVTHLASRDYPFIRYRTGDIAVLDSLHCPCGRGLPMLKEIQGRSTDFVVASNGTVMHGLALIYILRDEPAIKQFKIVQESVQRTRVLVVVASDFSKVDSDRIVFGFKKRLGQDVNIIIEPRESIPPEKSGKHRYVVSQVVGNDLTSRTMVVASI